ncbi:MAG: aldo/keto reductase [Calditrichia bacterium]
MLIKGTATSEATGKFAENQQNNYCRDAYHLLGRTGLTVSRLGFGTYRCQQNNEYHYQALEKAIENGCNIIDTASNYGDGMAEQLIGEVLEKQVSNRRLARKSIVLVSKVGYVQGESLTIAQRRESRGLPYPEMVKYQEGLWHCIHPDFIREEVERSRQHLKVDTIDIYLLHNPEYFLLDALQKSIPDAFAIYDEFYRRIGEAFGVLEELAGKGIIRYYGISSNTFPGDQGRRDFLSLARVWEIYETVCKRLKITTAEGHFAVIEFPYNWLETEAYHIKNNRWKEQELSVLELAEELSLGVLANRPLNAIRKNHLLRLAKKKFRDNTNYGKSIREHLDIMRPLEAAIQKYIKDWNMDVPVQQRAKLNEFFHNTEKLEELLPRLYEEPQLDNLLIRYFVPTLQMGGQTFSQNLPEANRPKGKAAIQGLFNQFNLTIQLIRENIHRKNYDKVKFLENKFDHKFPDLADTLTFSQKALLVAVSTPGVDVVLNGMRNPEYVRDSMNILSYDNIDVQRVL